MAWWSFAHDKRTMAPVKARLGFQDSLGPKEPGMGPLLQAVWSLSCCLPLAPVLQSLWALKDPILSGQSHILISPSWPENSDSAIKLQLRNNIPWEVCLECPSARGPSLCSLSLFPCELLGDKEGLIQLWVSGSGHGAWLEVSKYL